MGEYKGIRVVPKSETEVYIDKKVQKRHLRDIEGTLQGHNRDT